MSIRSKAAIGFAILIAFQIFLRDIGEPWQFATSIGGIMLISACIQNKANVFSKGNFITVFVVTTIYIYGKGLLEEEYFKWDAILINLIGGSLTYMVIQIFFRKEIKICTRQVVQ